MSLVKSPYDEKEYRAIQLPNGLRALLVSESKLAHPTDDSSFEDSITSEDSTDDDNNSYAEHVDDSAGSTDGHTDVKKRRKGRNMNCAACGLCVKIGSFHDPPEVPGLAHLLEHMLFMGSKKYPGENDFDKFISHHGGVCDASTDYEKTLFYFSANTKVFKEALDRFANFFVSPLLNPSSLDREIEAVDSEFQNSIQSDTHRIHQLFCSLAIPGHPLACFPWGNNTTLRNEGSNLIPRLKDFYSRYYSASCMTVTVVSEESLDDLESYVRESFASIPSHHKANPDIAHFQPVFDDDVFHQLYKVVPVKTIHSVTLSWTLPPLRQEYKAKPTCYIGWLLGHEGYGSVLSHLKKRNFATEIIAGTGGDDYEMNSSFTLFTCVLTLTEEGMDNLFECITVVFQYLKMLQDLGPQRRIYDELKSIEENEFNFKEEESEMDLAERLCESMQLYLPEHYLTGDEIFMEYNPQLISSIVNKLVPDSCNIIAVSPKFAGECNQQEKWFGTKYCRQALSDEWTQAWKNLPDNPDLYLPPPNTFIASEFALVEQDIQQSKYPVCIEDTPKHKLWYKKDDLFKLPRASLSFLFVTPLHFESIENSVLMELFIRLYNLTIMELGYEAKVAQLDYSISSAYRGLSFSMSGLSHKLPDLFKRLVDHFSKFTVNENQFEMAVKQLQRGYSNFALKPSKVCKFYRLQVLEKHHFPVFQRAKTLECLKVENFETFAKQLRAQLFVEALVQGNVTAAEARQLMNTLWSSIDCQILPEDQMYTPKCLRLPSNTDLVVITSNRDPQSPNTAITDYYQCSMTDPREEAMAQLLISCMDEPCFDTLRTKQQLGYTVYVTTHDTHNVTGLSVNLVTQATKFSYEYASKCMEDFVFGFLSQLSSWDEDDFQLHVDSLIDDLEEDDNCLDDEVSRNWGEILTQCYVFDRLEKQVYFLKRVSKTKACKWLERYTHPGDNYRKLSIKVVSDFKPTEEMDCNETVHANIEEQTKTRANQVLLKECDIDSFKFTLKQYPRGSNIINR